MKTIKRSQSMETWLQWSFWGLMLPAFGVILFGIAFGHSAIDILYRRSTGTFLDNILTGREDNPLEYYYAMIDRLVYVLALLIFSFICFGLYLWGGGPIVVENRKGVFSRYPKKESGSWGESDRGGTRLCEKVHNVLAEWKVYWDLIG